MNFEYLQQLFEHVVTQECILLCLCLIACLCLDTITGVALSIKDGSYSSNALKQGILSKMLYFCYIIIAVIISLIFNNSALLYAIMGVLVLVEVSSILENLSAAGLYVPEFLKNILKSKKNELEGQFEEKVENGEDK